MKTVYATTQWEEAEMIRLLLQQNDIGVHLANEAGAMYAVGIPTMASPFEIQVDEKNLHQARDIIDEYLENQEKHRKEMEDKVRKQELSPEEEQFEKEVQEAKSLKRIGFGLVLLIWLGAFLFVGITQHWSVLIYLSIILVTILFAIKTAASHTSSS